MDQRLLVPFLAAAASLLFSTVAVADPNQAGRGFAVVELFTSEGCSSCPPADDTLTRLSSIAASNHLPLYALEWHVDYWDSLGWKDPFSTHLATERQYAYARALPSSVYTPQVVMNGAVVPSWAGDLAEIEREARSLVSSAATAQLHLQILPSSTASELKVNASTAGGGPGAQVMLALVEEGLRARPTSGENSGQELHHSSVVRAVAVLPLSGGMTRFDIPRDMVAARAAVIGFLQERSMRIVAADRVELSARTGARLSGRVVDTAGRAVPGVTIQACSGVVCVPAVSGPDGAFTLDVPAPGRWTLVAARGARVEDVSLAAGQALALDLPLVVSR